MDNAKLFLAKAKKYHFWILFGLVFVLAKRQITWLRSIGWKGRARRIRVNSWMRRTVRAASTTAAVVWSFILILVFDFLVVRLTFALD